VGSPPHAPDGPTSHYQTRWWARIELDPWQPNHETIARQLVPPSDVLTTLSWHRKQIAGRLLDLALAAERAYLRGDAWPGSGPSATSSPRGGPAYGSDAKNRPSTRPSASDATKYGNWPTPGSTTRSAPARSGTPRTGSWLPGNR
jgi:hypothetical protein